jgi:hypothetical protein
MGKLDSACTALHLVRGVLLVRVARITVRVSVVVVTTGGGNVIPACVYRYKLHVKLQTLKPVFPLDRLKG